MRQYPSSLGNNWVDASFDGVSVTFTSAEGGSFVLSTDDRRATIYDSANSNFPACSKNDSYKFSLEAGGSITFIMSAREDVQYIVNIAVAQEESSSGNELVLGENTVTATWDGVAYTFTSESGGTFIVTSDDGNYALYDSVKNESYFQESSTPYSFTLEAGGSITLTLINNNFFNDPSTYKINIALAE